MKTTELAYWINERYQMLQRREFQGIVAGQQLSWKHGWSDDPVMGLNRYCNVHREDDKVTRWLATNWRPKHHAVWEIVLARMVNYIPTLEEISFHMGPLEFNLGVIRDIMKTRRARGDKVFTSAYTISTCGKSMDKIDYVVDWVVARTKDLEEQPVDCPFWDNGLAGAHTWMMQVDGLGSFLAAQVVADLKNTAGHPLQTAPDWWTWAAPGPGSLRGLEAFWERPCTPRTFAQDIKECWFQVEPSIDLMPRISMQDFQNCLCEFSKYMKIKEGRGHARNKYTA